MTVSSGTDEIPSAPARPPLLLRPMLLGADRVRTGLRLGILVLLLVVPGMAATTMYTVAVTKQVTFSAAEQEGIEVVRPALVAMSALVLGDQPDLEPVRSAAGRYPQLGLGPALADLPTLGDGAAPRRLALAVGLQAVVTAAGNSSNLILDPDLDSFYVMEAQVVQLPKVFVAALRAGSPREPGAQAAVAAQAVLAGELSAAAQSLHADVGTAAQNSTLADLAGRLGPVSATADAVAELARSLTATLAEPAPADPSAAARAAAAAIGPLSAVLTDLLAARVRVFATERAVVLGAAIGGFLIAGWFAAAVLWRTGHDVRQVVGAVTAIADGDLRTRLLPARQDEMGDIGRALSVARGRLQDQELTITQARVARDQQLRATFIHQRQAESQFRQRTQTVIDESTSVITDQLRLVTEQVADVRGAAEAIDGRIARTGTATATVVAQARAAEQVIASLEQSLRRVAEIAALVTGIAGQTRLLALNATIEAARAGDLGAGFTVVADEVKELASSTARSTGQITATISDLEHDTAAMSSAMSVMVEGILSIGETAVSLRSVAADQGELVGKLSARMSETLQRVEEMSGIAMQLERRQHERVASAGSAQLLVPGRPAESVTLANVSVGGLRCVVAAGVAVAPDDAVDVELDHDGASLLLHAQVVDVLPVGAGRELGLQFTFADQATADRLSALVRQLNEGP